MADCHKRGWPAVSVAVVLVTLAGGVSCRAESEPTNATSSTPASAACDLLPAASAEASLHQSVELLVDVRQSSPPLTECSYRGANGSGALIRLRVLKDDRSVPPEPSDASEAVDLGEGAWYEESPPDAALVALDNGRRFEITVRFDGDRRAAAEGAMRSVLQRTRGDG